MAHQYTTLQERYKQLQKKHMFVFYVWKRTIMQGFSEIVQLLLNSGADKDSLSEDNCTPVYYAVLGEAGLFLLTPTKLMSR